VLKNALELTKLFITQTSGSQPLKVNERTPFWSSRWQRVDRAGGGAGRRRFYPGTQRGEIQDGGTAFSYLHVTPWRE
jgi:hypothetical protein